MLGGLHRVQLGLDMITITLSDRGDIHRSSWSTIQSLHTFAGGVIVLERAYVSHHPGLVPCC